MVLAVLNETYIQEYLVYKKNATQENAPDSTPMFSERKKKHRPDCPSVFEILKIAGPTGFLCFLRVRQEPTGRILLVFNKTLGLVSVTPPQLMELACRAHAGAAKALGS